RALSNQALMGGYLNSVSFARKILQSSLTGVLAATQGRFFAPTNTMRNMTLISVLRPQGMAGGLIDQGLQRAGFGGWKGFDPTTPVGVVNAISRDLGAAFSKALAERTARGSDAWTGKLMRGMFGHTWTDAMSARAQHAFENSAYAERLAGGSASVGH